MGRKTTAKDVARAAGVSASTVDRVLNGRGGVDPDKERRVVEWARKLKLDRALKHRSARTLRIAVLIQAPDNPFYAEVQNAFAAANRAYGEFNIQFLLHHFDAGRPSILPRTVRELGEGHDGLILTVPQSDAVAEAIREVSARVPVVIAADLCRSRAMREGRCRAQSCRPRRPKVTAGSHGSLPRMPLIVWTRTFTLFLLRPRCRFRDFDRRASSPAALW